MFCFIILNLFGLILILDTQTRSVHVILRIFHISFAEMIVPNYDVCTGVYIIIYNIHIKDKLYYGLYQQ